VVARVVLHSWQCQSPRAGWDHMPKIITGLHFTSKEWWNPAPAGVGGPRLVLGSGPSSDHWAWRVWACVWMWEFEPPSICRACRFQDCVQNRESEPPIDCRGGRVWACVWIQGLEPPSGYRGWRVWASVWMGWGNP
jgi:hypothetical protein